MATGSVQREVAQVIAVQASRLKYKSQGDMRGRLQRAGSFDDKCRFDIWVIPRALVAKQGYAAVPVLDVRFSALPQLVQPAEWAMAKDRFIEHYQHLALGAMIPLFWWGSSASDSKWGLEYSAGSDTSVSFDDVLSSGSA